MAAHVDRERRPRDAASTRAAILESARSCFTNNGYEQVGVREIAQKAGVTAALINRYFGSKEALFGEVLDYRPEGMPSADLTFRDILSDRAHVGEALARRVLSRKDDRSRYDPMLVILRSVGQPAAETVLRERFATWLAPLTAALGGGDAAIIAEMIVATLAGFDLLRNVIKSSALAAVQEEKLVKLLGAALQAYFGFAAADPSEEPASPGAATSLESRSR
jgi:AcrR family transcriptional regulator